MTDADSNSGSSPVDPEDFPETIHGIDFSGGRNAGNHSWVASGVKEGGSLTIEDCRTASSLPGSATDRERFLEALRDWIRDEGPCAIGLDFPFSLPAELIEEDDWTSFVKAFPKAYDDEDKFRFECQRVSPGEELKRKTDIAKDTPFSPYNLRMYKQTFHGIGKLLSPLVQEDAVRVLPMQEPDPDKPWLIEVCPASSMKAEGLRTNYKGTTQEHRAARTRILKQMQGSGKLTIRAQGVLSSVVRDSGGDALDSVIAAYTTTRTLQEPDDLFPAELDGPAVEGHVYA